jgi:hypothetical protein
MLPQWISEHGSHPLGHEPWKWAVIIPHHLWLEYLTFGEKVGAKGLEPLTSRM